MKLMKHSLALSLCSILAVTGCASDDNRNVVESSDVAEDKVDSIPATKIMSAANAENEKPVNEAKVEQVTLTSFELEDGDDRSCGFKNAKGDIVTKAEYDFCGEMAEGMAFVMNRVDGDSDDHVVGYIDETGEVVIPVKHQIPNSWFIDVRSFSEGLVATYKNGKWGYMDKKGTIVVPYTFETAGDFHDGVSPVSTKSMKYGAIDKTGAKVIDFKYDYLGDFKDGLSVVRNEESGKSGFVDTKGVQVVAMDWDDATGFSEGLAAVAVKSEKDSDALKWGFVNTKGKVVVKPKYDMVTIDFGGDSIEEYGGYFENGTIDVYNQDDKFTVITIDKTGKELKRKSYDEMFDAFQ